MVKVNRDKRHLSERMNMCGVVRGGIGMLVYIQGTTGWADYPVL